MPFLIANSQASSDRTPGLRWLRLPLCALLVSFAAFGASGAAPSEYQVKAAFLYKLAQFVEWPAATFPDEHAPIVIGVLGVDPFGAYLDAIVQGERVGSHPLEVRRFGEVGQIDTCHILFISGSESDHLERVLGALKGRSILTVGDSEGFARRGGMVRFVTESKRIRLRVSLHAAVAGNLTISSKLLKLAEIVPAGGS